MRLNTAGTAIPSRRVAKITNTILAYALYPLSPRFTVERAVSGCAPIVVGYQALVRKLNMPANLAYTAR